jgi:hypothetical protein
MAAARLHSNWRALRGRSSAARTRSYGARALLTPDDRMAAKGNPSPTFLRTAAERPKAKVCLTAAARRSSGAGHSSRIRGTRPPPCSIRSGPLELAVNRRGLDRCALR